MAQYMAMVRNVDHRDGEGGVVFVVDAQDRNTSVTPRIVTLHAEKVRQCQPLRYKYRLKYPPNVEVIAFWLDWRLLPSVEISHFVLHLSSHSDHHGCTYARADPIPAPAH